MSVHKVGFFVDRSCIISSKVLEYSPIGLSQEIYFDPGAPLTTGTYTGEVSRMVSKDRDGIIINGNGLSASRGIFIHYGQYHNDWSQGRIILEVNGFNAMYRHLRNSVGMNKRARLHQKLIMNFDS